MAQRVLAYAIVNRNSRLIREPSNKKEVTITDIITALKHISNGYIIIRPQSIGYASQDPDDVIKKFEGSKIACPFDEREATPLQKFNL